MLSQILTLLPYHLTNHPPHPLPPVNAALDPIHPRRRHHKTMTSPAVRKPSPVQLWSHQETLALIAAYGDKWHSLNRGQLKAQQWETVAAAVAARCGSDPPKSGTQCRHKLEKLRNRFKSERTKRPAPTSWPYFHFMDRMERGPGALTNDDEDEDEDDDAEEDLRTRSINGIVREGNWAGAPHGGDVSEEEEEVGRGGETVDLAGVVRRFGEGMARVEKRRMEIMREMERDWRETERKRSAMVADSQRLVSEMIAGAFSATKKARKPEE